MKAHKQMECPLRVVSCTRPGCKATFAVAHRAEHEARECLIARHSKKLLNDREDGDSLTVCEICNDTSLVIRKRHLQRHQLYLCEKRPVPCRFAEWGCDCKFPRDEQEQHEATNCVVADRRRKIAESAQSVNEVIVCDWCQQTVKKRHLLDHQEDECLERERPCPNTANGCKEWVPVGKFDEHIRTVCSVTLERNELVARARAMNTPAMCDECGLMVKLRYHERHKRDECISRVVPCKNAAHGCKARLRWRDRHLHEEFASLSKDRSMLEFSIGGNAYIAVSRMMHHGTTTGLDIAPPWTAEYFLWMADAEEEILCLMRSSIDQVEIVVTNQQENSRWQNQSSACKKKLKDLKQHQKHKGGAKSSDASTPGDMVTLAKDLAETYNSAENGIVSTQKAIALAKAWIQIYVTEAWRILQNDVQDSSAKDALNEAIAAQTDDILQQKPVIAQLLPESEREMLYTLETWATHVSVSGRVSTAERQQRAKDQQKLMKKRVETVDLMAALDPGDADFERLQRRYNREIEKVDTKLALLSENTPTEILERRGRHIIASSPKNAISLVSGGNGEITFYRSAKAPREVSFQVQLERNRWYHLVFAASEKEVSLFLDGSLKSTKRGVFDLPLGKIGTDMRGESFQGYLQEVRCWKECRPVQHIQQTANTILDVAKSKSLTGYWTFEEAMGDLVDDMSLSLPRAPCFGTKWVLYNTPEVRKRFGVPLTPSFRDQTSCFINQRLKMLAQRARDREVDNVPCRQNCGETINVRRMEQHHRVECLNRMMLCKEFGCGQLHRFADQQVHLKTDCGRYRYREKLVQRYYDKEEEVECDLRCGEMVKKRFVEHHLHDECPNRLIPCPRSDCHETIIANTLRHHIDADCKSASLASERRHVANARRRQAKKAAMINDNPA